MPKKSTYLTILTVLLFGLAGHTLASDLRDPTRPYSVGTGTSYSAPSFRVNAIFVSETRRIAIVNGVRVGIGDEVNGATVTDIQKDHLMLEVNGRAVTAKLKRAQ